MLLVFTLAAVFWFWPGATRIPLSDGRTLVIAAVTCGVEHSHTVPATWRSLRNQFIVKAPYSPILKYRTEEPSIVLWFDDPAVLSLYRIVLVDRDGQPWRATRGKISNDGCLRVFPLIGDEARLRVEVRDPADELLGTGTIPVPRSNSTTTGAAGTASSTGGPVSSTPAAAGRSREGSAGLPDR